MNRKVNCILLIDDNAADNFFHDRVIKRAGAANTVISVQSAKKGLEYIQSKDHHPDAHPDLVFLDINMPGMNGWEFLDEYAKLDEDLRRNEIIVMLTTSTNPDDREKASTIENVTGFLTKPLSEEMLEDIMNRYFSA